MKSAVITNRTAPSPAWMGLILVLAGTIRLEAAAGFMDSVEWMVCYSHTVAVGSLKKVKSEELPQRVIGEHCVLTVKEMIKGTPQKEISFIDRHSDDPSLKWQPPQPGEDVLVFLSSKEDYSIERQTTWLPLAKCTNLMANKDMHLIPNEEKLLSLCRQWSASPIKFSISEEIKSNSELLRGFVALNTMYLLVPADEDHRLRFLTFAKSKDSAQRLLAAQQLSKFSDPESEAALRSLLDDTTERIWPAGKNGVSIIEYSVRTAAYRGLKQLGRPVPDLPLKRQSTAEEARRHRHEAWRTAITRGLQFGWRVADMHDGKAMKEAPESSKMVEAGLLNGTEKCTLLIVPEEFGKQENNGMEYLGFSRQEKSHFYSSPSMPPSLRIVLKSHFTLSDQP